MKKKHAEFGILQAALLSVLFTGLIAACSNPASDDKPPVVEKDPDRSIYVSGVWGHFIPYGIPLYALQVWNASNTGTGVIYDHPVSDGYMGGEFTNYFDQTVPPGGWACAAMFFAAPTGVIADDYELRFHIKGQGGLEKIEFHDCFGPPAPTTPKQFYNYAPVIRGWNTGGEWQEVIVPLIGDYDVSCIVFTISAAGGAGSQFYMDNIRLVPKN